MTENDEKAATSSSEGEAPVAGTTEQSSTASPPQPQGGEGGAAAAPGSTTTPSENNNNNISSNTSSTNIHSNNNDHQRYNTPSANANKNGNTGRSSNNRGMLTLVRTALDEWGLTYDVLERANPENPLIEFGMSGTYTNYRAIISMDLDDDIFAVYYVCPLKIIESRRKEMARYLAGANYKVMVGHFDLDFRDGEVRFKISVICKGTSLSPEMVKQMIGISMKTMDKFFPGMMACEFGNISADEALADLDRPILPTELTQ